MFDIFQTLGKFGVNRAPLRRRVLIIGRRSFCDHRDDAARYANIELIPKSEFAPFAAHSAEIARDSLR